MLRFYDELERRGVPNRRDTVLIGRTADIGIWYTSQARSYEVPHFLPPFGAEKSGLYRGFAVSQLGDVIRTGLDLPSQSAFFATGYPDKAWEYPMGRTIAAMLVLDLACAEKSYTTAHLHVPAPPISEPKSHRAEYTVGDMTVFTRFAPEHGTRTFADEQMYGHWIPGDARAALLGIVLGGPRHEVVRLLLEVQKDIDTDLHVEHARHDR